MKPRHPPWLRKDPGDQDVQRFARMTPDERLEYFVQACELAESILRGRADAAEVLARREPMSPRADEQWRALVARSRRARAA
ncbi:MAG: hypothetical protein WCJ30_27420 [Deltaproteobacteria bacterium]